MTTDRPGARQLSEWDRQREEGYVLREQVRAWGTCEGCNAILYGHRCWWCEPAEAESPTDGWDDVDWGEWAAGREQMRELERRGRHNPEVSGERDDAA